MGFADLTTDVGKDIGYGIGIGILFIFLNIISPAVSMGLPPLPASVADMDKYLVVGFMAPVFEEIAFRGALFGVLIAMAGIFPAMLVTSAVFSLYHWSVYGLGQTAGFIGAFIFSLMACWIVYKRGLGRGLLTAIIVHAIFNVYLLSRLMVVF